MNHLVVVIDFDEVIEDGLVVRAVFVVELLNQIENVFDLWHVTGRANPQLTSRVFEALGLDVLHLVDGEVALFTPLQLLVQEVEHREVERPDVIPARQVNIVVGIEGSERDGSAEISLAASRQRLLCYLVQVPLCQPEVHDEYRTTLPAKYKVGRLHIPVNETSLVHFAYTC